MPATDLVQKRSFVPQTLDPSDFANLEPLYRRLLDRPLDSSEQSEKWLADFSELTAVVDEYGSRRYIDKTCHTDDPAIEKRFLDFVENVEPMIKPLFFALQRKLLDSPARKQLLGPRFEMLIRKWSADVELFRDENVPLETQLTKLNNEYDKLCGAMTVQFRGREYTLQQLARFLEDPDRETRKEAWELTARRRLQDRDAMDGIFEKLLPLRQTIAKNAGLADYRAHIWKANKRFDYSPEDCLKFAEAIAQTCMPLVHELDRRRASQLKLERLRPWDLQVDPLGRPPLRPFDENDAGGFVNNVKEIFSRMSPQLGAEFESLRTNRNLDLQSRKGKQPGGYQCSLEESRQPFIFMNAAGLQKDVQILLHEGGHAFHFIASSNREPLVFLRSAPMEFAEVASMSMELLGAEHYDVFYDDHEAARAKRTLLEDIVRILPWIATIDSFQHWIYTHPEHSREHRTAQWLQLQERFGSRLDWTGYEDARSAMWHRQLHLFHLPFYYVEYGIAQLGALQLWLKSKRDPRQALAGYRAALALGGTRPLPDLFAAAGIAFDFSEKTLRPLMNALEQELEALPE
jgi:oligoendopeptidase F